MKEFKWRYIVWFIDIRSTEHKKFKRKRHKAAWFIIVTNSISQLIFLSMVLATTIE